MKFKYSTLKTIYNNHWFGSEHKYVNFRELLTAFLSDKDWILSFIETLEFDIALDDDELWLCEHNQRYKSTVAELKQHLNDMEKNNEKTNNDTVFLSRIRMGIA